MTTDQQPLVIGSSATGEYDHQQVWLSPEREPLRPQRCTKPRTQANTETHIKGRERQGALGCRETNRNGRFSQQGQRDGDNNQSQYNC